MLDLIQYGSDNVWLGEMNSVAVQFKFLSVLFFLNINVTFVSWNNTYKIYIWL